MSSCVLHVPELKKGIKIKECTCKDNKIITVGRNKEFISEIIGTTFYDQSILKRQF